MHVDLITQFKNEVFVIMCFLLNIWFCCSYFPGYANCWNKDIPFPNFWGIWRWQEQKMRKEGCLCFTACFLSPSSSVLEFWRNFEEIFEKYIEIGWGRRDARLLQHVFSRLLDLQKLWGNFKWFCTLFSFCNYTVSIFPWFKANISPSI